MRRTTPAPYPDLNGVLQELVDSVRAWDCRPDPALSVRRPAAAADFDRTVAFVRYVIDESKRYAAAHRLQRDG